MALQAERVGTCLAAEMTGIELAAPLDDAMVDAISAALVEHELLIFRDQVMTTEQQIALGNKFGELTLHPFAPNGGETPELIVFDHDENNPPWGTDRWHSDETFRDEPPMGTILRAQIVPKPGGDTVFSSMSAAYDGLSDRMQHFISGMEAVHDFKPFRPLFEDTPESRKDLHYFEDKYPPATHPIVREHPVSGRKVLFVNPQFTIAVKGMDERESRSLLDTLFQQILVPEYQYRVVWQPDTLIFWDNRSVQHYAIHDYFPQRRRLERVTIKGDRPFGPVAAADPLDIRPRKEVPAGGIHGAHGGHAPKRL
ncbi:MAG: TauD/TfdA family dioxygenase [Rhodospirillales bacterium]|nr:TauD/TfdA family dioxygenase [Rhodospirillales bacterium]